MKLFLGCVHLLCFDWEKRKVWVFFFAFSPMPDNRQVKTNAVSNQSADDNIEGSTISFFIYYFV